MYLYRQVLHNKLSMQRHSTPSPLFETNPSLITLSRILALLTFHTTFGIFLCCFLPLENEKSLHKYPFTAREKRKIIPLKLFLQGVPFENFGPPPTHFLNSVGGFPAIFSGGIGGESWILLL